ncbi:MAG: M28 family metallopeptidase, partial [Candidatus Aminicenantes bacterium]|nr:M28 family metallopeptidase [Candidatus Aminicenantes bacterium]
QGLPAEYQSFTFGGKPYTTRNIVATLAGKSSPEQEVIVCAHYDSYSNHASTQAPGADDNASGTAAVMETARILAGHSFDFTVKFICFSAEEWGLYGSEYYAVQAAQNDEKIVGVVNLDMISYAPSLPEYLDLYINAESGWLADRFTASANNYAPLTVRTIIDASATWSDHSSFWDQGYSALCGIEDSDNPYYHTVNDTFSTLNMDFAASITRAAVAAAADLAQPTYVVPTPAGLQARSQVSSSLFDSVKTVYLNWNSVSGAISGYNIYRTTTPHSNYRKLNSAPVTDLSYVDQGLSSETTYYYVVTAVDDQGRESNFSQEVRDDENNWSAFDL